MSYGAIILAKFCGHKRPIVYCQQCSNDWSKNNSLSHVTPHDHLTCCEICMGNISPSCEIPDYIPIEITGFCPQKSAEQW